MIALKIVLLLSGLTFSYLGYMIYFEKKYHWVNDFVDNEKNIQYSKKLGLIELIIGIACIVSFLIITLFFR